MNQNKKDRQIPSSLDPNYRNKNFEEVELNYTEEQALAEAQRCLECKNPKCVKGCPVNVDIPSFIGEFKKGEISKAGQIIRESNYLPSVCGRVCPQERQCEGECILGIKGEPVAIGALEKYIGDFTQPDLSAVKSTGKKIAIVGSGCAGMSAAADLAKAGHKVTVFEALHSEGGVLRYGIPSFRLPRTVLDREIEFLKKLGVEFITNVVIGKSLTIKDLFNDGYNAVFICSGAGLPKMLNIKGESLNGVYSANEFLTRINLMNAHESDTPTPVKIGKKAVVIGGGNTAMDSARTAKRIGFEEVTIVYRRSESELPARKAEIEHAKEEGVNFLFLHSPLEIIGENWKVRSLKLQVMELAEPDSSGRRRPIPIKDKIVDLELDTVIVALGTAPNPIIQDSASKENLDLSVNERGYIVTNQETGQNKLKDVWGGVDVEPFG